MLDGETIFKLYDTYGFPADLTADVARERGIGFDQAGFEAAMEAQRERARGASRFGVDLRAGTQLDLQTRFTGYGETRGEAKIIALLRDGERVNSLAAGEQGEVILEATPFYAESGGQVGDAGELVGADATRFIVEDTQKRGTGGAHSHLGRLATGTLREGMVLRAEVDARLRNATALNHSATHLLHAALRQVLGTHVQQKGSMVSPERLRFDFSHFQALTAEELQRIERLVNEQVRSNAAAETREMAYDAAVAAGARRVRPEKRLCQLRQLCLGHAGAVVAYRQAQAGAGANAGRGVGLEREHGWLGLALAVAQRVVQQVAQQKAQAAAVQRQQWQAGGHGQAGHARSFRHGRSTRRLRPARAAVCRLGPPATQFGVPRRVRAAVRHGRGGH